METSLYKELYENEESYWWFLGNRDIVFRQFEKYVDFKKSKLEILDIGCGTGSVLSNLKKYGNSHGIDNSEEALKFCKMRGLKNIQKSDATNTPYGNNSFDAILALDIMEHTLNDGLFISETYRILKNDGIAVITVPALNILWSNHDVALGHQRRYSKKELKQKILTQNFKILKLSYFNFFNKNIKKFVV